VRERCELDVNFSESYLDVRPLGSHHCLLKTLLHIILHSSKISSLALQDVKGLLLLLNIIPHNILSIILHILLLHNILLLLKILLVLHMLLLLLIILLLSFVTAKARGYKGEF
jgi:hypothetical protein